MKDDINFNEVAKDLLDNNVDLNAIHVEMSAILSSILILLVSLSLLVLNVAYSIILDIIILNKIKLIGISIIMMIFLFKILWVGITKFVAAIIVLSYIYNKGDH